MGEIARQRVGGHHGPEREQLVGALGEDQEEPVEQDLEDQKDRQQRVPHDRIIHSPVHQRDDPHAVEPLYLRPSSAEEQWKR